MVSFSDIFHRYPLVSTLAAAEPCFWFNPTRQSVAVWQQVQQQGGLGNARAAISDASARLLRFSRFLRSHFPETQDAVNIGFAAGLIESPLMLAPNLQQMLQQRTGAKLPGKLWVKRDSELPISGSIKARGGIYAVLAHAEQLAINAGLLCEEDDYAVFASQAFHTLFSQHRIVVGSTGNLGLSIGVMGAALGFDVQVHMSADAKAWKKDKLRVAGATVIEHQADYSVAVAQGRAQAEQDPHSYFIDDENSMALFLGYAVAGERLKQQIDALDIAVDAQHPLFVYLPCGVGGGPGGVALGLKLALGDHVHCIFIEPTQSPCMLLGVHTGLHDRISVNDIGLTNQTIADGLAVGRASGFVGRVMQGLIDGYITQTDDQMRQLVKYSYDAEGWKAEPSAAAALAGMSCVVNDAHYLSTLAPFDRKDANHLAWFTGGGMLPTRELQQLLDT